MVGGGAGNWPFSESGRDQKYGEDMRCERALGVRRSEQFANPVLSCERGPVGERVLYRAYQTLAVPCLPVAAKSEIDDLDSVERSLRVPSAARVRKLNLIS
jgi:hypothetical protein